MRRVWSIILTMAVLGSLLPLGISPAWSYYPPLLATASFGSHVSNPAGSRPQFVAK